MDTSSFLRWSAPRVMRSVDGFTMGAAQPQLLFMPATASRPAVTLLSGGRSGNFLWYSKSGERWSTLNLALEHNRLRANAPEPKALFTPPWTERDQPAAYNDSKPPHWPARGYCKIVRPAVVRTTPPRLCIVLTRFALGVLRQSRLRAEHGVHVHLGDRRIDSCCRIRPARLRLV